ncbi:MAG: DUF1801 domain-containing protein [Planctomycetes bacterium]|nr:DUF1801 domain-containing protein [Planctomycetota bacterium]
MAELKTQKTAASVKAYLAAVEPPQRRADAQVVAKLMREATGASPALWGPSIVGFGSYRYVYPSGREGEWPIIGFSPRKANLVLYLAQASEQRAPLLARLGKHKTGKACLYLNKLSDVDLSVLKQLIADSVAHVRANHACGACAEGKQGAQAKKTKAKKTTKTTKKKTKAKKTTKTTKKKAQKTKGKRLRAT